MGADVSSERVWNRWHKNEVNMVRLQAIRPARDLVAGQLVGHDIELKLLITRLKKDRLVPVAALGHMMGTIGHHNPRPARHGMPPSAICD
jgi:hypothetical protein